MYIIMILIKMMVKLYILNPIKNQCRVLIFPKIKMTAILNGEMLLFRFLSIFKFNIFQF